MLFPCILQLGCAMDNVYICTSCYHHHMCTQRKNCNMSSFYKRFFFHRVGFLHHHDSTDSLPVFFFLLWKQTFSIFFHLPFLFFFLTVTQKQCIHIFIHKSYQDEDATTRMLHIKPLSGIHFSLLFRLKLLYTRQKKYIYIHGKISTFFFFTCSKNTLSHCLIVVGEVGVNIILWEDKCKKSFFLFSSNKYSVAYKRHTCTHR